MLLELNKFEVRRKCIEVYEIVNIRKVINNKKKYLK